MLGRWVGSARSGLPSTLSRIGVFLGIAMLGIIVQQLGRIGVI